MSRTTVRTSASNKLLLLFQDWTPIMYCLLIAAPHVVYRIVWRWHAANTMQIQQLSTSRLQKIIIYATPMPCGTRWISERLFTDFNPKIQGELPERILSLWHPCQFPKWELSAAQSSQPAYSKITLALPCGKVIASASADLQSSLQESTNTINTKANAIRA